jgi:hypothetical protein
LAKRHYYLIVDTETTMDSLVADFGAIVVDKKGKIYNQCAVLTNGIFTDMENHPLFFSNDLEEIWTKKGQDMRYAIYQNMVKNGTRMVASVAAINVWLAKAKEKYNPVLTAYNLSFDQNKCANTGIDLIQFDRNFCLWYAAFNKWAHTKEYRKTVLALHAFNKPTNLGNMSFKTNAETMARFVLKNPRLQDEPHTALEDVVLYELPILLKLVQNTPLHQLLNPEIAFDWRKVQVRDWFKPA